MAGERMNARQWLGRARSIDREINALESVKAETYDRLLSTTQNYESDGAQSSKDPHKYDRLVELESLVDEKIDELLAVKAEITKVINQIPDGRQRTVLINYYIRVKSVEEVAVISKYSYRQTKRIMAAGVCEAEKILGEEKLSPNVP